MKRRRRMSAVRSAMQSAMKRQSVVMTDPSCEGPLESGLGLSWNQIRRRSERIPWERSGTVVRGVFLGYHPHDPEQAYGYVYAPDATIQEFSSASRSLMRQLEPVPAGALLIVTYLGLAPGKRGQQPKVFNVQWRRRRADLAWRRHRMMVRHNGKTEVHR
jgi:hypothetical protein